MINTNSLREVEKSTLESGEVKPLHESYCFSNIPHTVHEVLAGEKNKGGLPIDVLPKQRLEYDEVVLFVVDAFGWRFLEQYKESVPLLKKLSQEGVTSKLTAQFPSTTTAELTSLHTGLNVGQSGVFEWNYYEPKLDAMISPLPFCRTGEDKERNGLRPLLREAGLRDRDILPVSEFYRQLHRIDAEVLFFQTEAYGPSGYDHSVLRYAPLCPYASVEDGLEKLLELVSIRSRGYYVFYFGDIDSTLHKYGPGSPQVDQLVKSFFALLDEKFFKPLERSGQDPLVLITADHGQIAMNPQKTIYIDRVLPDIKDHIRQSRGGDLLVPGGSSRDMFLYIKPESLDLVDRRLSAALSDRARVVRTEDLVAAGYFGTKTPSAEFNSRVGNLVILPNPGESVYWWGDGRFEQKFLGHHGGLTREEMEIPLIAYSK